MTYKILFKQIKFKRAKEKTNKTNHKCYLAAGTGTILRTK
jgi:hypothetical protein